MFRRRFTSAALAAVLTGLAACGGDSDDDAAESTTAAATTATSAATSAAGSAAAAPAAESAAAAPAAGSLKGKTLTYWASNQGTSLEDDKKILTPEIAKFEQQTGAKVNFEVIPWSDLLNKIMTATTSGQGPDVLNIGNTWSASLQATGAFMDWDDAAFAAIGGKDKFLQTSMQATGAPGKPPVSVPIYGLAYGLFYNKKMFAEAGVEPPKTWEEFVAAAKKLTKPDGSQYGLTIAGASYTENSHFAFMFGKQQGADFFTDDGKPEFATPEAVKAVKQYMDLMTVEKVVSPSAAEHATTTDAVEDFTAKKATMIMAQNNAEAKLKQGGMTSEDYGVVPIPFPSSLPAAGKKVNSHVAGINISIFKNTKEKEAALEFVKFLTSPEEQVILNKAFGSLPIIAEAQADEAFQTEYLKVYNQVLAETAETMPMIPNEAQFETTVGNAMKDLFAKAATGGSVSDADIKKALEGAQQQMGSGS